jgi:hypothetical protein
MPIKMAVINLRASLIWKSEPPAAAHMDNLRTAAVVPADQKDGRFLSVPARHGGSLRDPAPPCPLPRCYRPSNAAGGTSGKRQERTILRSLPSQIAAGYIAVAN